MMKTYFMKLLKVNYAFFLIATLLVSCIKNIDLDQINDLKLSPVIEMPLIFFSVAQTDFVLNGFEVNEVSDVTRITAFDSSFIKSNLVKLEVDFEINNGFNRHFNMDFEFLDENDNSTYRFSQLTIASNQQNFKQTEIITIASNRAILSSKKVKITIHLLPSPAPLDLNVPVTFELKSAARIYIRT